MKCVCILTINVFGVQLSFSSSSSNLSSSSNGEVTAISPNSGSSIFSFRAGPRHVIFTAVWHLIVTNANYLFVLVHNTRPNLQRGWGVPEFSLAELLNTKHYIASWNNPTSDATTPQEKVTHSNTRHYLIHTSTQLEWICEDLFENVSLCLLKI